MANSLVKPPKVTVLLGVHNGEASIDKSIESLTRQTLKDVLILVVNDASTDGTKARLAKWAKKLGSKIKIVTNPVNLGLTKSLNKGLAHITSPYTARIDADDWWEPSKLADQVAFMEKHPGYAVVGCAYTNHGAKTVRTIHPAQTDRQIRASIIKRNPFAHSCVLFDTALVKKLGGYDETVRYGQDYDLWLRCYPHGKFHNLKAVLCHRLITGGISIEKQREQMAQAVRTQLKYLRLYRLPLTNYRYVFEPFVLSRLPRFITNLKRKITN